MNFLSFTNENCLTFSFAKHRCVYVPFIAHFERASPCVHCIFEYFVSRDVYSDGCANAWAKWNGRHPSGGSSSHNKIIINMYQNMAQTHSRRAVSRICIDGKRVQKRRAEEEGRGGTTTKKPHTFGWRLLGMQTVKITRKTKIYMVYVCQAIVG